MKIPLPLAIVFFVLAAWHNNATAFPPAKPLSSDASLKSLKLSTGSSLTSISGTSNVNYSASVTSTTTSLTVTPTTNDANATVKVNGTAVASGTASQAIAITTNPTVINLLVTAQDGTTKKTISITVYKNGSSDASLKSLKLSTGSALTIISGTSNVNYSASVTSTTNSLTVTPTTDDANATVTVNGTAVASGTASQAIAIPTNPTVINLLVTAQDGTTKKTISITVYKNGSNDASLKSLKLSTGSTLTSISGTSNVNYSASVTSTTTSLTVTPTTNDANATVKVNGTAVASGTASQAIAITTNPTVINLLVTAQDGTTQKTISITVYKNGSSDAALKSLKLSTGSSLTSISGTSNVNYSASVTSGTNSLKVTPTTEDANATVTVNGTAVASGTASQAIAIPTNPTVINLLVTAQDGTTKKTISITVYKNGSSDATLKSLKVSTGTTLTVTTGTSNVNYTTTVPVLTSALTVTPTANNAGAAITVNGTTVASGSASQSISLSTVPTVINLIVTAQDGTTTRSYSITVNKAGTFTWTGSGSNSNWSNSANWAPSTGFPTAGDAVYIGTTTTTPVVDVSSACASVTVTGSTTLTLSANLDVSGTVTLNTPLTVAGATATLTTGALTINFNAGLTNSGKIVVNSGQVYLNVAAYIDNQSGGIFNANNLSSLNMVYQAIIKNSGLFNITGSTVEMGDSGYIDNMTGGTFNLKGGSVIDFATNSASGSYIQNSGTFTAGSMSSACTINLNYPGVYLQNSNIFYLGSSSVINLTGYGTSVQNTGSFTLRSDSTGSATIGNISGVTASCTGTYKVERFITGGSSLYRGYRFVSSPVNAGVVNGNAVYSLNYLKSTSYITGTTGTAGGFDNTSSGNPSLYLFRENIASSNTSFTSGNYRGINDITNPPTYALDGDGGGFNIPIGNGIDFFYRGDRSAASFTAETTTTYVPTDATLTASGTLNQGSITVKDWYTPGSPNLGFTNTAGNSTNQGFNLVGNPYPSSIDWDTYNTSSSAGGIYAPNADPFIYVLDPVSKAYNVYSAGSGGVGTIATTGSNVIPSGQGFFVHAANASAQLVFNESAKTNSQANTAGGNLFMGAPKAVAASQYLRMKLLKDSLSMDGIMIKFAGSAKQQFMPGEDALYKPGSSPASISSMSADHIALAINAQPLPNGMQTVIPLNIAAETDGSYKIYLETIKNVPDLYDIWLKDAVLKDSLNLRHQPVYQFSLAHSDTNSYGPNRFSLVVRQNASLMVHLLNFTAAKVYNNAEVAWTTENEQNYTNFTVERSSDGGKTFNAVGGYASSGLGAYSLLDKTPPAGIDFYRLKLVDLNGTISYSNVTALSFNSSDMLAKGNISIYPNPSADMINLSVNAVNAGAAPGVSLLESLGSTPGLSKAGQNTGQTYDIKIISATGAVIRSATSSSSNWQANVSNLTPGTYILQVTNSTDKTLVGKSTFVKL